MTQLERQVHAARRRLGVNHWFYAISATLAVAATVFAVVVLIQRLYDLPVPLLTIAVGLGGVAFLVSIVWTRIRRADAIAAAARLDEAAGLRERISSGWYCREEDDPFAKAVVADAERAGASITVKRHIRFDVPQPLSFTVGAMVLAALMFLITPGALKSSEAVEQEEQSVELEQAHIAVKRQMDSIRRLAEESPAMQDFTDQLAGIDKNAGGKLERPDQIRHEAIKKIDKLEDAVKQKRASDAYQAVPQMRKMLRGLKIPEPSDGLSQKLAKALAEGDFKTAKEEVDALREQLATLRADEDKELVAKMSKQLEDLAKQLEKLAADRKLAQKLEQSGIKKEDVERLLERLSKEDLEQIKKSLEKSGMSQQQIEKIARQLQKSRQAGTMAKKLARGMRKGSLAKNPGQMGQAMEGLSQAGEQLSELEQLEQEMNQLDAALAATQTARNNIDKPCPG